MSHEDDVTAPNVLDGDDEEFGGSDYELDDDLDADDGSAEWDDEDAAQESASWDGSPASFR